jgi:hypothetical protein
VANSLRFSCKGRVGFIDWLGRIGFLQMPVSVQKNVAKLMQGLSGDIDLCVIHTGSKWGCANISEYELQPTTAAAQKHRRAKPCNPLLLVLEHAIIVHDFSQKDFSLKPTEDAHKCRTECGLTRPS